MNYQIFFKAFILTLFPVFSVTAQITFSPEAGKYAILLNSLKLNLKTKNYARH